MDSEHRELLNKTRQLIETTRGEISQLREEIELARNTVDHSYKLLARTKPFVHRVLGSAKAL